MNILVIDDDPAFLALMGRTLERIGGNSIVLSVDSASGLEMIGETPPDLLLIDWLMPGMSGVDVLTALQKRQRSSRPGYVVVMTAAPDTELLRNIAADLGADEVASKPLSYHLIEEIVGRAAVGLATSGVTQP